MKIGSSLRCFGGDVLRLLSKLAFVALVRRGRRGHRGVTRRRRGVNSTACRSVRTHGSIAGVNGHVDTLRTDAVQRIAFGQRLLQRWIEIEMRVRERFAARRRRRIQYGVVVSEMIVDTSEQILIGESTMRRHAGVGCEMSTARSVRWQVKTGYGGR